MSHAGDLNARVDTHKSRWHVTRSDTWHVARQHNDREPSVLFASRSCSVRSGEGGGGHGVQTVPSKVTAPRIARRRVCYSLFSCLIISFFVQVIIRFCRRKNGSVAMLHERFLLSGANVSRDASLNLNFVQFQCIGNVSLRLFHDKCFVHMRSPPEEPHLAWRDVTFSYFRHLSWAYFLCKWAKILICWCLTLLE